MTTKEEESQQARRLITDGMPGGGMAASVYQQTSPRGSGRIGGPCAAVALWTIVGVLLLGILAATTESNLEVSIRQVVIEDRLLITRDGRNRHRKRRRVFRSRTLCDETDQSRWWKLERRKRRLMSCVEYDLSLRRSPLGDNGVRALTAQLSGTTFAGRNGRLRILNLARQGITRRGAGYLARWLSLDPVDVDDFRGAATGGSGNDDELTAAKQQPQAHTPDAVRVPSAVDSVVHINLEGNPISVSGRKVLERAVERARLNGIRVFITGGGPCTDPGGKAGLLIKLGPVEVNRPIAEMEPWQIPAPWWGEGGAGGGPKWSVRVQAMVALIVGYILGRVGSVGRGTSVLGRIIPYRLAIVRRDDCATKRALGAT